MNLTELPAGPQAPDHIHVVIEIPRGGRVKYEYDPELQIFRVDRVLSSAMQYPAAYGFLPSSLADDGDALDVFVMISEPTVTGCLITARPIAVLKMRDEKGGDEKILAVAEGDIEYSQMEDLDSVPQRFLDQMEHFFRSYKQLDNKEVHIDGWGDKAEARRVINDCIARVKD